MSQKENNGLEFEMNSTDASQNQQNQSTLQKDPELKGIFRKSFRFPLKDEETVQVHINDQRFELVNIAVQRAGIGIRLNHGNEFSVGDELTAVQFKLDQYQFHVQGIIRHITPDGNGNYLCGIELVHISNADHISLKSFIRKCQKQMFSQ